MINQEILLYIKAQIDAGMPQDVIREMLISRGGWKPEDVAEAFRRAVPPLVTPIQSQPQVQPAVPQPVVQAPVSI